MDNPLRRLGREASRFLAVGFVATVVALVLFNLLVHGLGPIHGGWLNGNPEVAYVVANAVGMVVSFRGTKVWAFSGRESKHADGGVVAFVVINLATMLIPITCLSLSRSLGLDDPLSDNISANVVGLGLANAARFFLFRTFVFLRVDDPGMTLELQFTEPDQPTARPTSDPAQRRGL